MKLTSLWLTECGKDKWRIFSKLKFGKQTNISSRKNQVDLRSRYHRIFGYNPCTCDVRIPRLDSHISDEWLWPQLSIAGDLILWRSDIQRDLNVWLETAASKVARLGTSSQRDKNRICRSSPSRERKDCAIEGRAEKIRSNQRGAMTSVEDNGHAVMIWCDMIWYNMILYGMIWYGAMRCCCYARAGYYFCDAMLGPYRGDAGTL